MREATVETRGPGDARAPGDDDVVARWRQTWDRSMAAATDSGDRALVVQRRVYGSYLVVALDLILTLVVGAILLFPLIAVTQYIYIHTGHRFTTVGDHRAFQRWTQAPQFNTAALLLTDVGILAVIWYRLGRLRLPWSIVGLGTALRDRPGRAVLTGLGLGIVALILSTLVTNALQQRGADVGGQQRVLIQPLYGAPGWAVLLFVLAGSLVAPVAEETLFRGYIFRALAARKSVPLAYIISAGTFAAVHLGEGRTLGDLLPLVPALFIVGGLLCFAYHRTGNLLSDITAHVFFNGIGFIATLFFHQ
jgi:membrane protease YdiL (CAAX protease family)